MKFYWYLESNGMCAIILLIIIYRMIVSGDRQLKQRLFWQITIFLLLATIADTLWFAVESGVITKHARFLNYLFDEISLNATYMGALLWLFCADLHLGGKLVTQKRERGIIVLPIAIISLLTLTSGFTGWVFYIDEVAHYHRGPLLLFVQVAVYGYLMYTSIKALLIAKNCFNEVKKKEYFTLALFAIPPLAANVLQIFLFKTPLTSLGYTLAAMMLYTVTQANQVHTDIVTQLNNRNKFYPYLEEMLENYDGEDIIYLVIMELDYLKKSINGIKFAEEDDVVLGITADALREITTDYGCFVARIDEDRFCIIYRTKDEESIDSLCFDIKASLSDARLKSKLPYVLKASIGYAIYSPKSMGKDIKLLLKAATDALRTSQKGGNI